MRLVVLGGGESGVGAAILGRQFGYSVFLSDKGKISEPNRKILSENEVLFEEGQYSEEKIFAADLVVKSP